MNKEVYQEGWLIKSPPSKRIWRARWRRRWFTLKQGEIPGQFCLEYYTDRNCRKLKGVIDLDQCEQVDSGLRLEYRKQKFQHMFDIKTPRRTYYLAADTESDMRDWVNCICQVCNLHDFTKNPADRQYYNLCENGAPTPSMSLQQSAVLSNVSTITLLNNSAQALVELNRESTGISDVIKLAGELSIDSAYQNNDCAYVNTEYSNRETMICDVKFQDSVEQSYSMGLSPPQSSIDTNSLKRAPFGRSHSLKISSAAKNIIGASARTTPSTHIRTQSLNDKNTVHSLSRQAEVSQVCPMPPTNTKKIPENLVLSDTFVDSNVEQSPALSTSSGPYIPISECFSGSPKYLNEENPSTPLNNLDPKIYDTPRSHNNVGLNLTSDQSYSPKIYNCSQQARPRSDRSSPTDSESVFTDDEECPHTSPRRQSLDRYMRPSDSSVENENIVFTYAQRFSKIPDDTKTSEAVGASSAQNEKKLAKKKSLLLESCEDDEKCREVPQFSDTDNSSPAIGPKDASCVVEESYDIPRSHQLAYYNMNQINYDITTANLINTREAIASSTPNLIAENQMIMNIESKTLPRSHFYTNAAPTKIEGNVFRYDFIEQSDAPAVNRSLKPKLSLEDKASSLDLPSKPSSFGLKSLTKKSPRPPSVDRKLKPSLLKNRELFSHSSSLRRCKQPLSLGASSEGDFSFNHKDFERRTLPRSSACANSNGNVSTNVLSKGSSGAIAKSNSRLQYFDLDVANPPKPLNRSVSNNLPSMGHIASLNTSINSVARLPIKSNVVYNSVDFLKTEAFKRIREDAEKNRMKD